MMVESGVTTYDLSDRLGTASRQTNSATATATRTYDAFGMLVASTGTPVGPFGFAGGHGYQEDGDSGLKLLGHRYYDPSTGRFLTREPIKDGRNWHAYCDNNPLKSVDPTGYTDWWNVAKKGAIVLGVSVVVVVVTSATSGVGGAVIVGVIAVATVEYEGKHNAENWNNGELLEGVGAEAVKGAVATGILNGLGKSISLANAPRLPSRHKVLMATN